MIRLKKYYNHKGVLLNPGAPLQLSPEIEDMLIKSGAAEKVAPGKLTPKEPNELDKKPAKKKDK